MAFQYLRGLRAPVRERFFRVLDQAFATDDGKRILAGALRGLIVPDNPMTSLASHASERPYSDLGRNPVATPLRAPVFITARFRSGSTLLWNLFRHVPECTAFYEPLNERRWFDPSARGARVDNTHAGVTDYWREYDNLPHLGRWYNERWTDRHLYMDRHFWEPDLFAYVEALVDAAPHRAVLQFNRVDFRLPWLRQHFPSAAMIHLYRHPREQWCSALMDSTRFPRTGTLAEFEPHDHFYLLPWARDLSYHFPFLDVRIPRHPYELFYLVWKLSWLFGKRYCHASFCYERLCADPERELPRLMQASGVSSYDMDVLRGVVGAAPRPRWHQYAPPEWFEACEARAEAMLRQAMQSDWPLDVARAAQAS
jgi:hypothetical protein